MYIHIRDVFNETDFQKFNCFFHNENSETILYATLPHVVQNQDEVFRRPTPAHLGWFFGLKIFVFAQ